MKKCLIFDASNYIFRAYYASPQMSNSVGFPTNALLFYTSMILSIIHHVQPDVVALGHETRGPKFRHALYPAYKGQRTPPPEALVMQFPWFRQITDALGLAAYDADNYEADDVIATLTRQARAKGYQVIIASSDKDLMQLIERKDGEDTVIMLDALSKGSNKNAPRILTYDDVVARFNVRPEQVADVLSLSGDTIDNIPGCKGIGEKTAGKLIADYGSLESLMQRLSEIKKPAQKTNLEAFAPNAQLSKQLVSLVYDVPVQLKETAMNVQRDRVMELFSALDLAKLLKTVLGQEATIDASVPKIHAQLLETPPENSQSSDKDQPSDKNQPADESSEIPRAAQPEPLEPASLLFPFMRTSLSDAAGFDAWIHAQDDIAVYPVFADDSLTSPRLLGLALSSQKRSIYLSMSAQQRTLFDDATDGKLTLQANVLAWLADGSRKRIWNVKRLLQWGWAHGKSFDVASFYDVELAAYLAHPERTKLSLADCALEYLGTTLERTPENWLGTGKKRIEPSRLSQTEIAACAGVWAQVVWQLGEKLPRELDAYALSDVYQRVDLPIAAILARMESYGIGIDIEALQKLSVAFDETMKQLDAQAHSFSTEDFNINSPKSLGHFLFETLNLSPATRKRRSSGLSTDQDTLESIDHPIAPLIIEYRAVSKLRSTYAVALAAQADIQTHRIHGHFNECVTSTTRLSSSDPNLQNIPARTPLGLQIKRAFIPSEGYTFVSADYSQIELRLMAAMSGEPGLCEAYREGLDVHTRTAAALYGIPMAEVTKSQRQLAKTINFGLIYGMGTQKLARETGISKAEAKAFLETFRAQFPVLMTWLDAHVDDVRKNGEIRTLLGHRRAMPELYSSHPMIRATGERIANNAPIQGSGSDIVKCAMLRLDQLIRERQSGARLLVQVHDELLLETPDNAVEETVHILIDAMENAMDIGVPLKVEVKTGKNWADMTPFAVNT